METKIINNVIVILSQAVEKMNNVSRTLNNALDGALDVKNLKIEDSELSKRVEDIIFKLNVLSINVGVEIEEASKTVKELHSVMESIESVVQENSGNVLEEKSLIVN